VARKLPGPADDPVIVDMSPQRVVVVESDGDPNEVGTTVVPALYGAVYQLKFALKREGRDFKVGALRARWPNAETTPKEHWHALWALPVPDDVESVEPKQPGVPLRVDTWRYGTIAQVVHHGAYAEEGRTIERLRAFVAENGFEVAGPHEEEYLTRPGAKDQRTVIRVPVRPHSERPYQ
jgi:hypothetical protein